MKHLLPVMVLLCYTIALPAQLNLLHNSMRCGDEIIKQQVEYKNPGREGENVLWDFSRLKAVNPEYALFYICPKTHGDSIYVVGKDTILKQEVEEGELIFGLEHYTKYFYRVKNDTLFMLGHENPVALLMHTDPLLALVFPFNYGQTVEKPFISQGLYSSSEEIKNKGNIQVSCDAYGRMILPSGDTLNHVLRVKSVQDVFGEDSISSEEDSPLHLQLETYRWYAKGYRYPVFETLRSFIVRKEEKQENFTTAFFYPPQEHYYLSDDKENLAILDSLWNEENKNITGPDKSGEMLWADNFAYNYYPNPVKTFLTIEYMLEEDSEVGIYLFDTAGRLVNTIPVQQKIKGLYEEQMDFSVHPEGNYILRIQVNDESVNQKIVKK